ncbi:MAG: hypothetical protein WDN00_15495 [Limisphaerales bacterium]
MTALPGGGIQFTFDVPTATSYTVEASENLTSWQTVSSGVGQAGGESYSAPRRNQCGSILSHQTLMGSKSAQRRPPRSGTLPCHCLS